MVSSLSPQQFRQPEQVDLAASYLGGQRMAQGNQLQQQAIKQNEQQISQADYEQAVQRLNVINRLAKKVKELPQGDRYSFVQSINPGMLQSVGIDPKTVSEVQLDDNSLDALIAQTGSALPEDLRQTRVQSTQRYKNGTVQQVLSNGDIRITNSAGQVLEGQAAQQAIDDANKYEISNSADKAGSSADARNKSNSEYAGGIKFNEKAGELAAVISKGGAAREAEAIGSGRGRNVAEAEGRSDVRRETAQADYPKLEAQANDSIRLIDELLASPGRNLATGALGWAPSIPGTKQADFISRFDQVKGQAFLQAFESLKGGGAITEVEGKAATQAINRMNRSTTGKEFDSAANDLKAVLERGKKVLADRAKGGGQGSSSSSKKAGSEPSLDELLSKY